MLKAKFNFPVHGDPGDTTNLLIWEGAGNPLLCLADEVAPKNRRDVRDYVITAVNTFDEAREALQPASIRCAMNQDIDKTALDAATYSICPHFSCAAMGDCKFGAACVSRAKAEAAIRAYEAARAPAPMGWLVWSNEHMAWWRPESAGYTTVLSSAGRYTLAEAESICRTPNYRSGSSIDRAGVPSEVMVPSPELLATMLPVPPCVGGE